MPTVPWPAPRVVRPYGMVEFRAMASPCRIVADTDELARRGEVMVHDLERRWSRFRPDSEVSMVNDTGGAPCVVSAETIVLFDRAEYARRALDGRFNPFVLDRLEALGYGGSDPCRSSPSGTLADRPIDLMPEASLVRLPEGLRFDPGGIGKGLAADLVLEALIAAGSASVQIELGGDVRVRGRSWTNTDWTIDVVDPRDRSQLLARLGLAAGAAATSSVLGTRWSFRGVDRHHLIDPATGEPSRSDVVSVTATSSELWWAEVVAKSALIAGAADAADVVRRHGCAGLFLTRDGSVHAVDCTTAVASPPMEVSR